MTRLNIFLLGILLGIVLTAVGTAGILRIIDKGIDKVKTHSEEFAR